MSHTLSESAAFGSTVTVPDNGDAGGVASVNGAFSTLANRAQFAKSALKDLLIHPGGMRATGGDTKVYVAPFRVTIGADQGEFTTEQQLTASWTSATWYYVYAYFVSGTLTLEAVTTAPDAMQMHQSGDTTRRYIGCFHTYAGSSNVLPFQMRGGRYHWRRSAAAGEFNALTSGSATSATDVSLATWVPPHARLATVFARYGCTTTADIVSLRTKADSGNTVDFDVQTLSGQDAAIVEIETDSSQAIQYIWGGTGSSRDLDLYALGFQE